MLAGLVSISFGLMTLLIDSGIKIGISLPFKLSTAYAITAGLLGVIMLWIAALAVIVGQREEEASKMIRWVGSVQEALINVRYPLNPLVLYPVGNSLASLFERNRGWIMLVRTPGLLIRGEVQRRKYIEAKSDTFTDDWDVAFAERTLQEYLEKGEDEFSYIDSLPVKSQGKALKWGVRAKNVDIAVGIFVALPRAPRDGIEKSFLLKGAIEAVLSLVVRQLSVLLTEVIDSKNNSNGEMFGLLVKGLVHELSSELQGTYNKLAYAQSELENDRRLSTAHQRNFALASSSLIRSHHLIELMRDIPYVQDDVMTIQEDETVEFKKMLADIIKEMREAYPEVIFSTKGAADLLKVSAGTNIRSVLRNTIRNAASFTPDSGMVQVKCSRKDNLVKITVTDDGPGVSEKDLELVFDPSKASKVRPNGTKGMGVGMYISRRIARAYGGNINCISNNKAKGGCFEITLPILDSGDKP